MDAFERREQEHDRVLGHGDGIGAAVDGDGQSGGARTVEVEAVVAGARELREFQAAIRGGDEDVSVEVADEAAQKIGRLKGVG